MKVLVIGPGAAVIGEGGELDAAAAQAAGQLRQRGHEVVCVTSNPATVASDPSVAERTYLEPRDVGALRAIMLAERPSLVLPTFGGAKALALALALSQDRTLSEVRAELLGISAEAIVLATTDAAAAPAKRAALAGDPSWTTIEVVAAFDTKGTFTTIAMIESLDRADVHPGDAVAVTPPLHASPTEIAELTESARVAVVTAGLRSGIATCELALRRAGGTIQVLAVVPGFTRSSALAAHATGYPVATVAVDLALGRETSELGVGAPTSRGVVVRWPRFAFETFPDADAALGAHRKSLGETLGTGSTLADALRSAARGVDDGLAVARPVKRASMQPASKRIIVLGAGPSRIGQGPELATCASEALVAARELGLEPVFVDPSVEAASIAARVADHVHLEPVTLERVLAIHDRDRAAGVIVQVGGEIGLRLAADLVSRGVHVFGTTPAAIARALDTVDTEAHGAASSRGAIDEAIAVAVDAVSDGRRVVIAGVTEQLEPAFVHGGDAAAILPAFTLRPDVVARIEDRVRQMATDLRIVGLLSVRLAVMGEEIVVLEVLPRAGGTTAFVSRATGFPLVRIATKVMLGKTLDDLGVKELPLPRHVAARERVFPFERLGVDPALGREMRSTGEVIGLDDTPARAYAKALRGIGISLRAPASGAGAGAAAGASRKVLLCVTERDKTPAIDLARRFRALGFDIVAIGPAAAALGGARIPVEALVGTDQAAREIRDGRIAFAIVTARGDAEVAETRPIRSSALAAHIPCFTTIRLAGLGCAALEEDPTPRVRALQDWYAADV